MYTFLNVLLLGNVGVYPIKAFVLWMWGYNCFLSVLELKFLCYTTICVDCSRCVFFMVTPLQLIKKRVSNGHATFSRSIHIEWSSPIDDWKSFMSVFYLPTMG